MEDNVIKVSVRPNKQNSVKVSSNVVSTPITANSDTSQLWSQVSKNWAVSENIVDNTDYSSKYYANKAKENATTAQGISEAVKSDYNEFLTASLNANEQLQTGKEEALTSLESARADAENSINNTKTTAISDIEFVADGEKKEIEDLIDSGKEELKESIGDVKILTTLKIGQIGIAPLGIDETLNMERYLNGQIIIQDQFKGFTQFLKKRIALYPSIACLEDEWQNIVANSDFSQCGKFVIDDNAGTIRLPKVVNIQGLTDLSKLGEIVEAGLPNIAGTFTTLELGYHGHEATSGALYSFSGNTGGVPHGGGGTSAGLGIDASRSNSVYGKSNTVQQEQIQYPYFIQVATGAETEDNIINEIELNNPFSLLDYKFSEYELNNLSWLRSNGQYNSKAIYPAVYDLLLKIYNGTEIKAGVSVKLSTDTSATDYDFRINIAEETFRLPVKVKLASGKAVVGNGMTLGVTNGTLNAGLIYNPNNNIGADFNQGVYGSPIYSYPTGSTLDFNMQSVGVTTDETKSGIETSDSGLYLYFYVGETVQNANLINAGRIEEKLVDKVDMQQATIASMPSSRYVDLTLGASGTEYTAPANGFVILDRTASAAGQYMALLNISNQLNSEVVSSGKHTWTIYIPVKKGDKFTAQYSFGGTLYLFRFIYAEGEK